MTQPLEELIKWFPTGTAEGEKAILEQVFVYVDEFKQVMNPPEGSPHLLIGPKGSGKSAILDFMLRIINSQDAPAILITPFDIPSDGLPDSSSTGDSSRFFYASLLSAIANKLSHSNSGWLSGDRAELYRHAVATDQRSPDFLGRMGAFISAAAKPLVKIDLNTAFPLLNLKTRSEISETIERVLGNKSFYSLIDDIDQIGSPNQKNHLNRVWSLMLAARKLSSDIPTVKCILSLRSEVWNRLRLDESGQRDQTDHFTSLIVRMKDEREQVSAIIRRRLSIASSRIKDGQDYRSFFENDTARAPMSKDYRTWHDLIVVRSRGRPRDAIQLINMLSKRATSDRKLRIDEDVFHAVMPTFSTQIAQKFGQEVAIECPQTLEILRTFAGVYYDSGGFTMSSQQALEHFKASLSRFSVYLYGYSLNQQRESDIFELWRFFYISGVLNGRVTDVDEPQGYRHLDPESDPTLVSKSRWNELQGIVWEMNTAYRDFLIGIQEEQQSRFGLADKTKFRKNPGRSKKR